MGPQDGREGIVEVTVWLVDVAEGAVSKDGGPELDIEQPALQVDKLGSEGEVALREGIVGAEGRDAVEEHVDGDLEAALCAEEEVLGGEDGERLH